MPASCCSAGSSPTPSPGACGGIPEDFDFGELPEDLEHFEPILAAAIRRVPALEKAGIASSSTGRKASRPTTATCSARRRSCSGLFVAAGFNSIGIQSAGGAGKVARRLDRRRPSADGPVGCRHPPHAAVPGATSAYLADASPDRSACSTPCTGPYRQYESARGVRRSPLHDRLARARRLLRRGRGLGARELVRAARARRRIPL